MNLRLFLQLIKKKLTSLDKFPHWTTTKPWFRNPPSPHLPKFHLFTKGQGGGAGEGEDIMHCYQEHLWKTNKTKTM